MQFSLQAKSTDTCKCSVHSFEECQPFLNGRVARNKEIDYAAVFSAKKASILQGCLAQHLINSSELWVIFILDFIIVFYHKWCELLFL